MARGTLKNLKRSRPVGGKPTTTTGIVVEPDHHPTTTTTTTTSISSSTAVNQQQQHFPSSSPRGAPSFSSSSSSSTMPLDQYQHHNRQNQHAPPPPSHHHHQQQQRQEKEDLSFIRGGGNWLNCECFFSLLLVGLLAALALNLHFSEIFQPRGSSLIRAKELSRSGAYDKAIPLYERALKRQATLEGYTAFAEALIHLHRSTEASRHLQQAEHLLSSLRGGQHQKEQVKGMDEMGRLYYQLGRFDLAGPHFQNILSIKGGTNCPEHPSSKHYLPARQLSSFRSSA